MAAPQLIDAFQALRGLNAAPVSFRACFSASLSALRFSAASFWRFRAFCHAQGQRLHAHGERQRAQQQDLLIGSRNASQHWRHPGLTLLMDGLDALLALSESCGQLCGLWGPTRAGSVPKLHSRVAGAALQLQYALAGILLRALTLCGVLIGKLSGKMGTCGVMLSRRANMPRWASLPR